MALRVAAAAVSSGATTTPAASWAAVTEPSRSTNGRGASSLRIGCPTFSSRMQPISASRGAISDRRELVVASASGRRGAGRRGARGEVSGNASAELASGGGDDAGGRGLAGYGGGDGEEAGDDSGRNREEALMVVTALGKTLENLPADLASAIQDGRITADIVNKYFDLEGSGFFGWLMKFGGFKERLLADDLFLTKVGIECGVGIFTKVIILSLSLTPSGLPSLISYPLCLTSIEARNALFRVDWLLILLFCFVFGWCLFVRGLSTCESALFYHFGLGVEVQNSHVASVHFTF